MTDVRRRSLAGWSRERLRFWLLLIFLAIAAPTAALVLHAYSQLKWEAFRQHQQRAEELAARIDARFIRLVDAEEARGFADYGFLVVTGGPAAGFVQRSPLAAFPVASDMPGLIGYFQVDADGNFSTPLLPPAGADATAYGVTAEELAQRATLAGRVSRILGENRLVQERTREPARVEPAAIAHRGLGGSTAGSADAALAEVTAQSAAAGAPSPEAQQPGASQEAFDKLDESPPAREQKTEYAARGSLGQLKDLNLDYRYQRRADSPPAAPAAAAPEQKLMAENIARVEKRGTRRERGAVPEPAAATTPLSGTDTAARSNEADAGTNVRIRIFESEIDGFAFALLDSGEFVLYRTVWRDGKRYIQGALIDRKELLDGVIGAALRESTLAQTSDLVAAWRGEVLSAFPAQSRREYLSGAGELHGAALYQARLSAPLGDLELLFSIARLPAGPGAAVINWLAAILAIVLCGGFWLLYRLGLRQLELAQQQQDFVSAVSHELKTPLTSIRMYAEMLREGLAPEGRKQAYYCYIHDESQRLSRLIGNVLQLARVTRGDAQLELRPVRIDELMMRIRQKIESQTVAAGFELSMECPPEIAAATVDVDEDAFSQVMINLVDNAVKFSAGAQRRIVEVACRPAAQGVVFSVRDYGPGVPRDQLKKIFGPFYRAGNELTRETVGTGIGLALASQLVQSMRGSIDVDNRAPGAEFQLRLPLAPGG